jgi:hypothetical protein
MYNRKTQKMTDEIRKCARCKCGYYDIDFGFNRLNKPYKTCNKCRLYYEENKEEIKTKVRKYSRENKEKITENKKEYYRENKDEIDKKNKLHRKSTLEILLKAKFKDHKREDKHYNRLYKDDEFVTIEYIKDLLIKCNNCCCLCFKQLKLTNFDFLDKDQFTIDRIDNTKAHIIGNVQIACLSCNVKKH